MLCSKFESRLLIETKSVWGRNIFLNTFAQIFFIVGIFWGALACVLMIAAWRSVRLGNIFLHRRLMLILLVGGWSFVSFYLIGFFLGESYSDNVAAHIALWLAFHGLVALSTLFTVTVLVWARLTDPNGAQYRLRRERSSKDFLYKDTSSIRSYINTHHRIIGTCAVLLWLLTQAGGFINLYLLK